VVTFVVLVTIINMSWGAWTDGALWGWLSGVGASVLAFGMLCQMHTMGVANEKRHEEQQQRWAAEDAALAARERRRAARERARRDQP
jgi:hypothetical protein